MTTQPDNTWRGYYGADTPPNLDPEQLALDEHDPDAMTDRESRLRAELDHLDAAKLAGKIEALDHIRRRVADLAALGRFLDGAVAEARAYGATWQQIADAAGMTRQSAHERWAR